MQVQIFGSGPALLMLHGAGGTPRDDFPFLNELATAFTIAAPSLTCASGDTAEDVAGRVVDAVREAGIRRFSICGYSMGTTVAAAVADRVPADVDQIALCAGFAHARPSLRLLTGVWRELLDGPPELLGSFIASVVFRPTTLDNWQDDQLRQRTQKIGQSQTVDVRAHLGIIDTVDTRSALQRGKHPMLLVVPKHDVLVHPGHSNDVLACRPDAARVEITAGHALGEEVPNEWFSALVSFFSQRY